MITPFIPEQEIHEAAVGDGGLVVGKVKQGLVPGTKHQRRLLLQPHEHLERDEEVLDAKERLGVQASRDICENLTIIARIAPTTRL